jgi:hypothetical protein
MALQLYNVKINNDFLVQCRSYAKLLLSLQFNTNKYSTIGAKIIQFVMKCIVNMSTSNVNISFL